MLRAGMGWDTDSQLWEGSWQHPPCSRVMRVEALSWDNKIFMSGRRVIPSCLSQSLFSVVRHESQIAALPMNVCVTFFLHQWERYQGI